MNRMQIVVLGVSVAAFGAAYVLFNTFQTPPQKATVVVAAPKLDLDEVLVATQDIPMGSVLNEPLIGWQQWPKAAVSDLMVAKSSGPTPLEDVKGSMTRMPFLRGEPLRRDKMVKAGQGGFMSAVLPGGKRAVAIRIANSGDSSAGGFILPNDRVDVVQVARDDEQSHPNGPDVMRSQTILSNVKVLAIGQNVQEENGKKVVVGGNATLELTSEQSELVILAQQKAGSNLYLLLRSLVDSGGPTQTVIDDKTGKGAGMTIVRYGAAQQAAR